jgi:hypothetical protein
MNIDLSKTRFFFNYKIWLSYIIDVSNEKIVTMIFKIRQKNMMHCRFKPS